MKKVSTTALAKLLDVSTKMLFADLVKSGMIVKNDNVWELTSKGKEVGGEYRESEKYGRFIVWPDNLNLHVSKGSPKANTITATVIGKQFNVSANKINFILSELGWVKKDVKGWLVTVQGTKQGAVQSEDRNSGIPYVRWPESILHSTTLIHTMKTLRGEVVDSSKDQGKNETSKDVGFREKFEAKHRATDGHFVRSKAEMLIDNYLYMAEIVHAYERKLPIKEDVYSDFYLPTKKVYIEYWGYDNDAKYLARKKIKQGVYEKYGFNLIELTDAEVQNLDDVLPRLLLKFGITAY